MDLQKSFSEILTTLIERGFVPPMYMAALANNGEAMVCEIVPEGGHLGTRMLCQHSPLGFMALPINIMYVDQRGEAARVMIGEAGAPPRYFLN